MKRFGRILEDLDSLAGTRTLIYINITKEIFKHYDHSQSFVLHYTLFIWILFSLLSAHLLLSHMEQGAGEISSVYRHSSGGQNR